MKTAIAVSDSHGNRKLLDKLDGIFSENDLIIHLGDTSSDGNYLRTKYPQKTHVINGNCDLPALGSDEEIIEIEGVKILACHGHRYSVKSTLSKLAERAKELGCAVALYGHTHTAREDVIDGVTLINPGNLTRYGNNSYLYIAVHCGKITYKIVTIG